LKKLARNNTRRNDFLIATTASRLRHEEEREFRAMISGASTKKAAAVTATPGPSSVATSVCALRDFKLQVEPFAHVIRDQFIAPEIYRQLCQSFPTCPPSTGPTGFSLYWGDKDYQQLLDAQPAWQALFNTFHSQQFIDWCRRQFATVWDEDGCLIDLSHARYVPYREDRIDKERATLRRIEHEPDELWIRMDIHQGQMGYDRPVHLDHARRLMSMLVYMCDHNENQMVGGELFLHDSKRQQANQAARITPRHNLMVAFPCTPRSYHSVSAITSMVRPRNYIQVHISSSVDVWPREAVPRWRRTFPFLKRHLKTLTTPGFRRWAKTAGVLAAYKPVKSK
jgi:2-oxoglutarate-Fe(II)-dependent oxygenase superfamily protein